MQQHVVCGIGRQRRASPSHELPNEQKLQRVDRVCELNVIEQVANVCQTTIARDAWDRGQDLSVHGWVYGLKDGLLRDLGTTVTRPGESAGAYRAALSQLW